MQRRRAVRAAGLGVVGALALAGCASEPQSAGEAWHQARTQLDEAETVRLETAYTTGRQGPQSVRWDIAGRLDGGDAESKGVMQVGRLGGTRQGVQVQGQLHQHALAEVAHGGHEQGAACQAGAGHDLGDVLVLQAQCVGFVQGGFALLVGFDHGASAARVAAHRGQGHRVVLGQQAGIDQGAQQGDGARGVAARVGHATGLAHGLFLARGQLGKAIDPARAHAVGGRGIDDLGARATGAAFELVDQGHGLAGGVVVQAQNDQVDTGQQLALGGRVFAPLGGDAHQFDGRHVLQPLPDLQAGGACFAVNKNQGHGVFLTE